MAKTVKKLISVFLAVLMLVCAVPLGGFVDLDLSGVGESFTTKAAAAKQLSFYDVGDIIQYGSYPQTKVTDSGLVSKLEAANGTWKSYGYMSGSAASSVGLGASPSYNGSAQPADYMQYKDVTVDDERYRAVKFTKYRKEYTNYKSDTSTSDTDQATNGYYINTTYWFKFETLDWRVLDPQLGLVMCEDIIDSQPYSNTIYSYYDSTDADGDGSTTSCWKDAEYTIYANNYAESSIRAWLNDDFYYTAFSNSEQENITTAMIDNKAYDSSKSAYDSAATSDKVFMLAYDDVLNTDYGFSACYSDYDINRRAAGSDYAKCQGLYVYNATSYTTADGRKTSHWWLRSAGRFSNSATDISLTGYAYYNYDVGYTFVGVRPALYLNPSLTFGDSLFSQDEYSYYLGQSAMKVYLEYESDEKTIKDIDVSKIKWTVSDSKTAAVYDEVPLYKKESKKLTVMPVIIAKKIGETTLTATLPDGKEATTKIIVEKPNELTVSVNNSGLYYEYQGVIYNDAGTYAAKSVPFDVKFENNTVEEVKYEIKEKEYLDQCKFENIKLTAQIVEGSGFSFSKDSMQTSKTITVDELELYEEKIYATDIYCLNNYALTMRGSEKVRVSFYYTVDDERKEIEDIEFTVTSYTGKFVNEHIDALKNGGIDEAFQFREMLGGNNFAEDMMKVEDEFKYKWFTHLNESIAGNVISYITGSIDEKKGYEIVLGDLIGKYYDEDKVDSISSDYFGKEYLDIVSNISGTILDYAKTGAAESIQKIASGLTVGQIEDVISGKTFSGDAYDTVEFVLNSSFGKNVVSKSLVDKNIFVAQDVFNDAKYVTKLYNYAIEGYNNYVKVLNVVATMNAFSKMNEQFKNTFALMKKEAIKQGNNSLANALQAFIDYSDENVAKRSRGIVDTYVDTNASYSIKVAYDSLKTLFGKTVNEKIVKVVGEGLFADVGFFMTAIEIERSILTLICGTDGYVKSAQSLISLGYISKALTPVVKNMYSSLVLNKKYETAKDLECALDLLKNVQLEACDKAIKANESQGDSLVGIIWAKIKGENQYVAPIVEILNTKRQIEGAACHLTDFETIFSKIMGVGYTGKKIKKEDSYKVISVCCPVDVTLKDSKDNVLVKIANDELLSCADNITVAICGDKKYICVPSSVSFKVDITATDNGEMNYIVSEYDSKNTTAVRNIVYENVTLTKSQQFVASVNEGTYSAPETYDLKTNNETISFTEDTFVKATDLTLSETKCAMTVGQTKAITASILPTEAENVTLSWTSSNEAVAKVSSDGIITANTAGTAVITCKTIDGSGLEKTAEITVGECEHTYSSWTVMEESTCSSYGYSVRSCTKCGVSESKLSETKPEHKYGEYEITDATCTESGYKLAICSQCGNYNTVIIHMTGHLFSEWKTTTAATCKASGTQLRTCSKCKTTETKSIEKLTTHTYDNGKVTKAATCKDTGVRTYTCKACGLKKTETIAKLTTHIYKDVVTKATTSKDGKIENKCSVCGKVSKTTTIYAAKSVTLKYTSATYTGKALKPTVSVKDSKSKTIDSKYYTVKYTNNTNVGKATVTVTLKGNYSGTLKATFNINPKGTTLSSITAKSKGFTAKWKKQATQTTGYQIQYSTSSKFTSKTTKSFTVKDANTLSKTVSKLKSSTKYYVRIRTYKTVGKTNYYSAWSKTKTVTTKK